MSPPPRSLDHIHYDPLTGRAHYYERDTFWEWLWWWVRYRLLTPWPLWYPRRTYRNWSEGIQNLWHYGPILWRDRVWDHDGMMRLWLRQFERRAEYHSRHGHLVNADRTAKQLRVCAELLRRNLRDSYDTNAKATPWAEAPIMRHGQWKGTFWAVHAVNQQKRDTELLGKLIGKYLNHWWD